jgi:hypothetical protein
MHVVWWKVGGKEPEEQLTHFAFAQPFASFDCRTAGVGGGEPLQPVGPAAEPPPRQVRHHLTKARFCIKARVRGGHGVHHERTATEPFDLETNPAELLAMELYRIELLIRQFDS